MLCNILFPLLLEDVVSVTTPIFMHELPGLELIAPGSMGVPSFCKSSRIDD